MPTHERGLCEPGLFPAMHESSLCPLEADSHQDFPQLILLAVHGLFPQAIPCWLTESDR